MSFQIHPKATPHNCGYALRWIFSPIFSGEAEKMGPPEASPADKC